MQDIEKCDNLCNRGASCEQVGNVRFIWIGNTNAKAEDQSFIPISDCLINKKIKASKDENGDWLPETCRIIQFPTNKLNKTQP